MMHHAFKMVLGIVLLSLAAGEAPAEWRVWTAPASERLLRAAPAGTGRAIRVAAARNEWRGFQIMVRSDTPVKGIDLRPGRFGDPQHPVASVRLYREHQMEITTPTQRNKAFTPGWYPDPLIPFTHPLTGAPLKGGELVAVPFDLPAAQTHGFWVDLDVLPDARAGEYPAEFTLSAADGQSATIRVQLKVWDFALPSVPSLHTSFGSPAERMSDYYARLAKEGKAQPIQDLPAVERQCNQLLAEHGIAATPPSDLLLPVRQPNGDFRIPAEKLKALGEFIDRYRVNALDVPKAGPLDESLTPDPAKIAAWLRAYDEAAKTINRPGLVFYTYLTDEPNDAKAYELVRKWGTAIRQAHSVVKAMVTEQTKTQDEAWGNLYGAVDIWCPLFPLFDSPTAAARQKLGETIWAYTALCQLNETPWWHIDYPLLNYRVPAWIAWRYRIRGLLYWGGMCFWNETRNPWNDAWTYGHRQDHGVFNGEGTLAYPGRAVGYEGIAPSMRLKALRDGIEDYDYLVLLEKMGRAAEAEKIVAPLAESWFKWDRDPAAYDRARAQLAALILQSR